MRTADERCCDVLAKNPNAAKAMPTTAPSAAFLGLFLGRLLSRQFASD